MVSFSMTCWFLLIYALGVIASVAFMSAIDHGSLRLGYMVLIGLLWPFIVFCVSSMLIAIVVFIVLSSTIASILQIDRKDKNENN